jgi:hypothetical protein
MRRDGILFLFEKPRDHPSVFEQSQNHPATFLADLKPSRFFFSSVKPLLALLLFCTNSNVNMQRMALMKDTVRFRFNYFV